MYISLYWLDGLFNDFFLVCVNGKYILNWECVICLSYCKNYLFCNKLIGKCDNECSDYWIGDFCLGICNFINEMNRCWKSVIDGIKGIC